MKTTLEGPERSVDLTTLDAASRQAASRRLRVLMSAYGCAPDMGSEPAVGWNWAREAARKHDVWVLTWERNRESIERVAEDQCSPNLHFAYYDLPFPLRNLPLSERQMYLLWELFSITIGRRLHDEVNFDIVHHLTYNTIEVPGLLWTLGPRFIWGPIGGGQVPPSSLSCYFRWLWPIEVIRGLRKRFLHLNPLVRLAMRRATTVLAANHETARLIESFRPRVLIREPEIAIEITGEARSLRRDSETFTIAWSGRLMPRKGPLLALDIAAELKRRSVRFHLAMVGDGQWRRLIEQRVRETGLDDVVSVLGRVPYTEMPAFYQDADVLLFTSLQDTSGTVLLEAMAHGLPLVALDHQGASDIVGADWGIKVPVTDKCDVIRGFADALQSLANNRERLRSMGEAGRRRAAARYTWQGKADLLSSVYAEAVSRGCEESPVTAPSGA